ERLSTYLKLYIHWVASGSPRSVPGNATAGFPYNKNLKETAMQTRTWTDAAPLGSPQFRPTADRPVGWRGDWTGRYPGATPPTQWERRVKGITSQIKYQAAKPGGEPAGESHPLEYFTIKEWLVAGPFDGDVDKDFVGGEEKLEPGAGATWKR